MWHRPSRWTVAAFAFVVVAGFIAWLILGRAERTIRLADGREFSVVAVTYGTNHVLEGGPPWARLLARLGSRPMAYRFGFWSSGSVRSPTPCLVVWTQWASGHSNAPPRFASVADSSGFETEPADASLSQTTVPKKRGMLFARRFDNYPRLQKEFALRFYEYDLFRIRARPEGEVTVRNPAPIATRSGFPPNAPVTATNGVLECTLVSFTCGGPPPRRPLTAKNAIAPWATAEFEFRENGQPTTDWTIKRVEAFGATGNYFAGDRLAIELERGRRVAHFTGAFWRDEPDWRLIAEVSPTRDFPAESLWTIRLPTTFLLNNMLITNLQAQVRGLISFQLTVGPDLRGKASPGRRVAFLRANYTPAAPDLYVDIASAVDNEGRELRATRSLVSRNGVFEADIELPANAQYVDLTFAIDRSRRLEFRVRPEIVSTNAAVNKP